MNRKVTPFSIINTILLLGVIIVTLYPFMHMAAVSLSGDPSVMRGEVNLIPKEFTLKNYEYVLRDPRIGRGYLNTLLYVSLGTAVSLVVTAMGAYALSKERLIFRKGFMLMIVFTLLFSGGMIPTFLVVRSLGLVDTIWAMILPTAVSTWNLIIMRTFFFGDSKGFRGSGKNGWLKRYRYFCPNRATTFQACISNHWAVLCRRNLEQFYFTTVVSSKRFTLSAADYFAKYGFSRRNGKRFANGCYLGCRIVEIRNDYGINIADSTDLPILTKVLC